MYSTVTVYSVRCGYAKANAQLLHALHTHRCPLLQNAEARSITTSPPINQTVQSQSCRLPQWHRPAHVPVHFPVKWGLFEWQPSTLWYQLSWACSCRMLLKVRGAVLRSLFEVAR